MRNRNVVMFYQMASIFNFSELVNISFTYIERCFLIVCKKNNFKNLSFALIAKIISSSELNIDSEMEVINAIDNWIRYDFEERCKFASKLLSKVRLNLLSVEALNSILEGDVSFSKIEDCVTIMTNVFKSNESSFTNKLSRYCTQDLYNIILSGGYIKDWSISKVSDVTNQIDVRNFNNVKNISSLKIERRDHKSVYCRGEVYVFGGFDDSNRLVKSVEKYSLASNRWENVGKMFDGRVDFNVCSFMDELYIFGGCNNTWIPFYSCKKFDTNNNKWYEFKRINKARIYAASTVYEGRIIVSGGINNNLIDSNVNTVETYDPFANTWSSMPNMIEGRSRHSSVALKNKLFVFGSYDGQGSNTCEVFDSSCKKFVMLKEFSSTMLFDLSFVANTFSIGNTLFTIGYNSSLALYYDVERDEWSEEILNLTNFTTDFSCTLIPQTKF